MAGQITYGSSKATEAFTRSIAIEIGMLGYTIKTIPLARIGTPKDIADIILFLASEKVSWLTTPVIKVSGGHAL